MDDPDGGVTGETWQWASSSDGSTGWAPISGATAAAYTPAEADGGMYLQATVSYTDGEDSGKSATSGVSGPVITLTSPMFNEGLATGISVAENTAAGDIGDPFTATDADGGTPVYSLASGTDASFSIDAATGQLSTTAELDYETAMSHTITVEVRDNVDDAGAADTAVDATIDVIVTVTNEDEDGTVTLPSTAPQVGTPIMASVTDPDGAVTGETWQWASSDAMGGTYTDIEGATDASYTPVDGDEGMYLRATAAYDDGVGADSAMMVTANAVVAATAAPTTGSEVGDKYDTNPKDGVIDKEEARTALTDYFANGITKEDARAVLTIYFKS